MASFQDNSITDIGLSLLAEVELGAVFTPTRIVVGSGYLPDGMTVRTVKDVVTPIQSMPINKKVRNQDGTVVFGCVFTNANTAAPFYYRELALYAKAVRPDGTETEEILYSYGNAGENAELIEAYSTSTAVERQLDLIVYIGNDATIHLSIQSDIYVTQEEYRKTGGLAIASGTGAEILLTLEGAPDPEEGDSYSFRLPFDIEENATVSFNGQDPCPLYMPNGMPVTAGFAVKDAFVQIHYNETLGRWYLIGGSGESGSNPHVFIQKEEPEEDNCFWIKPVNEDWVDPIEVVMIKPWFFIQKEEPEKDSCFWVKPIGTSLIPEDGEIVLNFSDNPETAKYFVEIDGQDRPLENVVDSDSELAAGNYKIEIL